MQDLATLIAAIESAGYDWAVGGGPGNYTAAIETHPYEYIGDAIHGPGCRDGSTPYEALNTLATECGVVRMSGGEQKAVIDHLIDRIENLEAALGRILEWANAYPLSAFPEPDKEYYKRAAEVLEANGMTLDRLSAAAMRHVIKGAGEIARDALIP